MLRLDYLCSNRNPVAIRIIEKVLEEGTEEEKEKICFHRLCGNPAAIHLIRNSKYKKDLTSVMLASNPAAFYFLEKLFETGTDEEKRIIPWGYVMRTNPSAVHFTERFMEHCQPEMVSRYTRNPTIPFLMYGTEKEKSKINWQKFVCDPASIPVIEWILSHGTENEKEKVWLRLGGNPAAMHLIDPCTKEEKVKMLWGLSGNPAAIHIIEEMLNDGVKEFDWFGLSCYNPAAIHLIENIWEHGTEKEKGNLHWRAISANPAAVPLIERILKEGTEEEKAKINWEALHHNSEALKLFLKKPCKYRKKTY